MRTIRTATAALVLATGLVIGGSAWADDPNQPQTQPSENPKSTDQTPDQGAQPQKGHLSSADKTFLKDAYGSASAEKDIGHLAADRGGSDAVKTLGKNLVDDEQEQITKLKGIMQDNDMQVPQPEPKYTVEVTRLTKLSGPALDKAFLEHVRSHQQSMLTEFQREAKNSKNPELQSYADNQISVLKGHIDQARNVGVTNAQPANKPQKGQTNKQPNKGTQPNQGTQPNHETQPNEGQESQPRENDQQPNR